MRFFNGDLGNLCGQAELFSQVVVEELVQPELAEGLRSPSDLRFQLQKIGGALSRAHFG